jgi:hypothetical protein
VTKTISGEERLRRQAAIDVARGSGRLEGFVLSPEAEEINRRFIAGELTTAQHMAEIQSLAARCDRR